LFIALVEKDWLYLWRPCYTGMDPAAGARGEWGQGISALVKLADLSFCVARKGLAVAASGDAVGSQSARVASAFSLEEPRVLQQNSRCQDCYGSRRAFLAGNGLSLN
jgi:hypothetical protein